MLLDRLSTRVPPPSQQDNTIINNDQDWTALANAAMENADLDVAPHLPPPPKVIKIDDDDDENGPSNLPSSLRQTLQYIPKI